MRCAAVTACVAAAWGLINQSRVRLTLTYLEVFGAPVIKGRGGSALEPYLWLVMIPG